MTSSGNQIKKGRSDLPERPALFSLTRASVRTVTFAPYDQPDQADCSYEQQADARRGRRVRTERLQRDRRGRGQIEAQGRDL